MTNTIHEFFDIKKNEKSRTLCCKVCGKKYRIKLTYGGHGAEINMFERALTHAIAHKKGRSTMVH